MGGKNQIDAAKAAGVKRFILVCRAVGATHCVLFALGGTIVKVLLDILCQII